MQQNTLNNKKWWPCFTERWNECRVFFKKTNHHTQHLCV